MRRPPALVVTAMMIALAFGGPMPRATADPTLADVQVVAVDNDRYVVTLRSSGAQPFDVVSRDATTLAVRLHRARLGMTVVSGSFPFGSLSASEDAGGVIFRIALAGALLVDVQQGRNASVVEVRISLRRPGG